MHRNGLPLLFLLLLFWSQQILASRVGVGAVGLGAFSAASVGGLSDCAVNAGGDIEVAALAYSFNPSGLFANWTLLVQQTLPRLNGRLYLTTYLDDGPNRRGTRGIAPYFRDRLSSSGFWRTLSPSRSVADQASYRQFIRDWGNQMVQPFDDWVVFIRAWAAANGYADKLILIVVPVLEDDAGSNLVGYGNLLTVTQELLKGNALHYRRNPNNWIDDASDRVKNGLRVNDLPLEFHTNRRTIIESGIISGTVEGGDVINNDGSTVLYPGETDSGAGLEGAITIDRFRSNQQFFLDHRISSLLWRFEFNANGAPRLVKLSPDQRGVLVPLDNSVARDRLTRTFRAR
jgi:hypothetical protein